MKKTVISIMSALTGAIFGIEIARKFNREKINRVRNMSDKHFALFLMMNQWVKVKQEGKKLADYFEKNGYKRIAVYGMNYAGETLVRELKETDITVVYGIDRNADSIYADVDIVTMEDELEPVDAVVVTAITFFDELEQILSGKMGCPILSLEDLLFEV